MIETLTEATEVNAAFKLPKRLVEALGRCVVFEGVYVQMDNPYPFQPYLTLFTTIGLPQGRHAGWRAAAGGGEGGGGRDAQARAGGYLGAWYVPYASYMCLERTAFGGLNG